MNFFTIRGRVTMTRIGPVRFYLFTTLFCLVGCYGVLSIVNSTRLVISGVKTTAIIVEVESMVSSGDV